MTQNNSTSEETATTETPTWMIDDSIAGTGARPEWLPEKFKSVADMGKSYHELEKKFGTVPDEYDISSSRYLDPDYVPFQELLALAKEKRVPKEVIDKMVESIDKYNDEFVIDGSEEMKKLGDNAKDRIKTLDNWAQANLTPESYNALTNNLKTADAVKALEELRGKMMSGTTVIPGSADADHTTVQTLAQVKEELSANLPKYKTDPKYRAEITAKLEAASKNSGYLDKFGS